MPKSITRSRTFEQPRPARRRVAWIGAGLVLLAACGSSEPWHALDVTDSSPALALTMTRASDGRPVTAADYRGQVVMLYFGYTFCPDVCPMTLANVVQILDAAGSRGAARPGPVRDGRPGARHSARARRLRREFRAAVRGSARHPGPARGAGAALPDRLFRDPRDQGSPLRSDPQLGDLCLRCLGRGPPAGLLARDRRARTWRAPPPTSSASLRRSQSAGIVRPAAAAACERAHSSGRAAHREARGDLPPSSNRSVTGTEPPGVTSLDGTCTSGDSRRARR